MVSTQPKHNATLITICNYNEYQFGRNADETQTGTQTGTLAEHPRNKEEELKNFKKEEVSKKETRELALVSVEHPDFDSFWSMWPNRVGKPAALKALASARKRASLNAILDGVQSYIRDKPPDRPWLNPATFLNQNRWEDQPAKVENGKPQNAIIRAADNLLSNIARISGTPRPSSEVDRICGGEGPIAPRLLSNG